MAKPRGGVLPVNEGLAAVSRLSAIAPFAADATKRDVALLLGLGLATGALVSFVKLRLGIPGHAILLSVPPAALGVALVPRRFAGTLVGGAAMLTMLALGRTGAGALAGMLATGVLVDLALRKARPGAGLYAALVAAGVGANLIAFVLRGGVKLAGVERLGGSFAGWWSHALLAYVLCGAVAGLASAVAWFQLRPRRTRGAGE
jgi:hypothetical protein